MFVDVFFCEGQYLISDYIRKYLSNKRLSSIFEHFVKYAGYGKW
jgi:hypothetical protein